MRLVAGGMPTSSQIAWEPALRRSAGAAARRRAVDVGMQMRRLRGLPLCALLLKALDEAAHGPLAATPNTQRFNMTGQPAISLPLSWNAAGLPIGTPLSDCVPVQRHDVDSTPAPFALGALAGLGRERLRAIEARATNTCLVVCLDGQIVPDPSARPSDCSDGLADT